MSSFFYCTFPFNEFVSSKTLDSPTHCQRRTLRACFFPPQKTQPMLLEIYILVQSLPALSHNGVDLLKAKRAVQFVEGIVGLQWNFRG